MRLRVNHDSGAPLRHTGNKEFAETRVPTLDDGIDAAGRGRIYLDCKDVAPQALVDAIDRHKMNGRVMIYGSPAFLKDVLALRPELKAMPEAHSPPS